MRSKSLMILSPLASVFSALTPFVVVVNLKMPSPWRVTPPQQGQRGRHCVGVERGDLAG